jgi:hypothetical protein
MICMWADRPAESDSWGQIQPSLPGRKLGKSDRLFLVSAPFDGACAHVFFGKHMIATLS